MRNLEPHPGGAERRYPGVFATAGTDEQGAFLEVAGARVRVYLAGGVLNISADLAEFTDEPYAFHLEGAPAGRRYERAGVPRSMLA